MEIQGYRSDGLRSSAVISPCMLHRYELRRAWDKAKPVLVVCMLNPSTADASHNDPTIYRLMYFAKAWGYGALYVINLFTRRTSRPDLLVEYAERNGLEAPAYWGRAVAIALQHHAPILVAWGRGGDLVDMDQAFQRYCIANKVEMVCLGHTKDGFPKHPMARGEHRIPDNQQPEPFRVV